MRRRLETWRKGRHGNIPTCCIVWFLLREALWLRFVLRAWRKGNRSWYVRRQRRTEDRRPEYIRCPVCIARGRVAELHLCTEVCYMPGGGGGA